MPTPTRDQEAWSVRRRPDRHGEGADFDTKARRSQVGGDPPPLKWSDLKYVFWHEGGPKCRGSIISLKRSSRSCGRSMFLSRRDRTLPTPSARSGGARLPIIGGGRSSAG